MEQSLNGLIYEIVDIPESFEIGKLKDFCKRLVREIESVESIRSSVSSQRDFDDLEENREEQILEDETTNVRDEDKRDDVCNNFYENKTNTPPAFIFHLDTDSNNELTSNTLKLFDDIFKNASFEIKLSKIQDDQNQKENHDTKPQKIRNKVTRRRIRKSFIHDQ